MIATVPQNPLMLMTNCNLYDSYPYISKYVYFRLSYTNTVSTMLMPLPPPNDDHIVPFLIKLMTSLYINLNVYVYINIYT